MRTNNEYLLMLDSGGSLIGKPGIGTDSKGKAIVEAMNLVGYDAMTIGDRELMLGAAQLREWMAMAKFPMISANVVVAETGQLVTQPSITLEKGGLKIGIVGLSDKVETPAARPGEKETLLVQDPMTFGKPYVEKLAKEVDVLIVLSHMGNALDEQLAAQIPAIDLIVGGKDRMLLQPTRYDTNGPLITQVSIEGQIFGIAELKVDRAGVVQRFSGKLEAMSENYAEDADMVALLAKYR